MLQQIERAHFLQMRRRLENQPRMPLTWPPGHHESDQVSHLRRQARRFRRRPRHPSFRRPSGRSGDLRRCLSPQGHREPDRRPARRREGEPEFQSVIAAIHYTINFSFLPAYDHLLTYSGGRWLNEAFSADRIRSFDEPSSDLEPATPCFFTGETLVISGPLKIGFDPIKKADLNPVVVDLFPGKRSPSDSATSPFEDN